ncbi:Uma2 family endonuclease [Haliscomenobacter sp.]|uniref:Uma2 family endonuclease n=1 Tax=Haliscomenobacter sp. TaxID=2717303 RepID=UPI0035944E21
MSANTVSLPNAENKTGAQAKPERKLRAISWAEFQTKYLSREDGYKYEWVNQQVVKSKNMDYSQFFIVHKLLELFEQLRAAGQVSGMLMPEGDIFFGPNHRRPDVAYLSKEQIARTAHGENQVPAFVIEIISTKDQMNLVHGKMENYREGGVKIVWHVFPLIKQVHVYSGKGLKKMTVCIGEDVCSAKEVLAGFEVKVEELFRKPEVGE